ncbi:hypothetical protein DFJ77DRAFT_189622 [Powellomyces hirtus]|nr:hypothetical protein DFJ77DRAFT_189622 [Powellomyces hirtus]
MWKETLEWHEDLNSQLGSALAALPCSLYMLSTPEVHFAQSLRSSDNQTSLAGTSTQIMGGLADEDEGSVKYARMRGLSDIEISASNTHATQRPSKVRLDNIARTASLTKDDMVESHTGSPVLHRDNYYHDAEEQGRASTGSRKHQDARIRQDEIKGKRTEDQKNSAGKPTDSENQDEDEAKAAYAMRNKFHIRMTVISLVRNLLLIILCLAGGCVGGYGLIVVENRSWQQTFTGLGFGILVQLSLVPIVEFGRMLCQHWFARKLTVKGMKAREMMTAWSALYSGSYRGVEDVAGIGPIAGFLILIYAAEAVVIGAVGNLYRITPTLVIKATNTVPLHSPMSAASWRGSQGLTYESYVTDMSSRNADNWITLTQDYTRVQFMKDRADVSCRADGCTAVVNGVFSPLAISSLKGAVMPLPKAHPSPNFVSSSHLSQPLFHLLCSVVIVSFVFTDFRRRKHSALDDSYSQ